MILKGEVSSIQGNKYRVFFKDKDFLSSDIECCVHVGELQVNDKVVVAFYNGLLSEGAIIGKL